MKTKAFGIFLMLLSLGALSAKAATPVATAVWESGEFEDAASLHGGYVIDINGNSINASGNIVTQSSSNKAALIKITDVISEGASAVTVLYKYKTMTANGARFPVSVYLRNAAGTAGEDFGALNWSGNDLGLFFAYQVSSSDGNYWRNSGSAYTAPMSADGGTLLFSFSTSGTANIYQGPSLATMTGGQKTGIPGNLDTYDGTIEYIGLGGHTGKTSSAKWGSWQGLEIEKVAIFIGNAYTKDDLADYVWPSGERYAKWNYAEDVFTWTSPVGTGDMGGASKFTLFDRASGSDTATVYTGNATTTYGGVSEVFWHNWCDSGNAGDAYTKPGLVLRLDGEGDTEAEATIGGTFGPVALGGMIVEPGATGYDITQSGSSRSTIWGDPAGEVETWFEFNESFTFNRGGTFLLSGTINIDVVGTDKIVTFTPATALKATVADRNNDDISNSGTVGGTLKLHGEGSIIATGGIDATGSTLDYSDLSGTSSTADGAFIQGTLTIDENTRFVFPEGTVFPYYVASSIAGSIDYVSAVVTVGGETKNHYVANADGSIAYVPTLEDTKGFITKEDQLAFAGVSLDEIGSKYVLCGKFSGSWSGTDKGKDIYTYNRKVVDDGVQYDFEFQAGNNIKGITVLLSQDGDNVNIKATAGRYQENVKLGFEISRYNNSAYNSYVATTATAEGYGVYAITLKPVDYSATITEDTKWSEITWAEGKTWTDDSSANAILTVADGVKVVFDQEITANIIYLQGEGNVIVEGTKPNAVVDYGAVAGSVTLPYAEQDVHLLSRLDGLTLTGGMGSDGSFVTFRPLGGSLTLDGAGGVLYYLSMADSSTQTSLAFNDAEVIIGGDGISVGQEDVAIGGSSIVTAPKVLLSNGAAGRTASLTVKDTARISVTGTTNGNNNKSSIMFGHWNGPSAYTQLDKAEFSAPGTDVLVGLTRNNHTINLGGGIFEVRGIKLSSNATGTNVLNLNGGMLKLGETGITSYGSSTMNVNVGGDVQIVANASNVPITQVVTVAEGHTLTVDASAGTVSFSSLVLEDGAKLLVAAGRVVLSGSVSGSGIVEVASGSEIDVSAVRTANLKFHTGSIVQASPLANESSSIVLTVADDSEVPAALITCGTDMVVGNAIKDGSTLTMEFEEPVSGSACWFDWEWTGSVKSSGTDISSLGSAGNIERHSVLTFNNTPYLGINFSSSSVPEWTAAIRTTISPSATVMMAAFGFNYGTSNNNWLGLVGGADSDGNYTQVHVVSSQSSDTALTPLCTMTVNDAATSMHTYTLVKTESSLAVYLDGVKQGVDIALVQDLGTGFQLGSIYGGIGSYTIGGTQVVAMPSDDPARIDFLRIYKSALSEAKLAAVANAHLPKTWTRTMVEDGNWHDLGGWNYYGVNTSWSDGEYNAATVSATDNAILVVDEAALMKRLTFEIAEGKTLTLDGLDNLTIIDNEITVNSGTLEIVGEVTLPAITGSGTLKIASGAMATVGGTISDTITIEGETGGTIVYDGELPPQTYWTEDAWQGTLWIKNYNTAGSNNCPLYPHKWGNAHSKIKWTNVSGYLPAAGQLGMVGNLLESEWILENGEAEFAIRQINGYSGYWLVVPKVSGSGTITAGSAQYPKFRFADVSEFTGTITSSNSGGGMGVIIGDSNSGGSAGTITVLSGADVAVAGGRTWTAVNGFVVNGNLTLADNSSAVSGAITGSGTVTVNAAQATAPTFGDGWTGEYVVAETNISQKTSIKLPALSAENVTMIIKGITGASESTSIYLGGGGTAKINGTLRLDGALRISDGNSNATYTWNKVTGSGNMSLTTSAGSAGNITHAITTLDNYAGTIDVGGNAKLTIGSVNLPIIVLDGPVVNLSETCVLATDPLSIVVTEAGAATDYKLFRKADGKLYVAVAKLVNGEDETYYSSYAAAIDAATEAELPIYKVVAISRSEAALATLPEGYVINNLDNTLAREQYFYRQSATGNWTDSGSWTNAAGQAVQWTNTGAGMVARAFINADEIESVTVDTSITVTELTITAYNKSNELELALTEDLTIVDELKLDEMAGAIIKSGDGKLTAAGANARAANWVVTDGTLSMNGQFDSLGGGGTTVTMEGGTLDIAGAHGGQNVKNLIINGAGVVYTNSVGVVDGYTHSYPFAHIQVNADSYFGGDEEWGAIASQYAVSTIDIAEGHTFTKLGSGTFHICNMTIGGLGTLVVENGALNNYLYERTVNNLQVKNSTNITGDANLVVNNRIIINNDSDVVIIPERISLGANSSVKVLNAGTLTLGTWRGSNLITVPTEGGKLSLTLTGTDELDITLNVAGLDETVADNIMIGEDNVMTAGYQVTRTGNTIRIYRDVTCMTVNPATGENVAVKYAYTGVTDGDWTDVGNWSEANSDYSGWSVLADGAAPGLDGSNRWKPILIDGTTLTLSEDLIGWALQLAVANGADVTIEKLRKFQDNSGAPMWLMVDGTSSLKFNTWNNEENSEGSLYYYVASKDGVTFDMAFNKNVTTYYYLAGEGSVNYAAGVTAGTHTICQADMTIGTGAYKQIIEKTLVAFSNSSVEFLVDDGFEPIVVDKPEIELVYKNSVLSGFEEEGTWTVVQDADGVKLQYIGYGDTPTTIPTMSGNGTKTWGTASDWDNSLTPVSGGTAMILPAGDMTINVDEAFALSRLLIVNTSETAATVTISGETLTATTISVQGDVVVKLESANQLSGTLQGDGTIAYTGVYGTPLDSIGVVATSEAWQGTVEFAGVTQKSGWKLVKYGSINSTVRFNGVTDAYFDDTETYGGTLEIGEGGFTLHYANSGRITTVGRLAGSGLFKIDGGSASGATVVVQNADDFTGSITMTSGCSQQLVFGDSGTASTSGRVIIESGKTVTIHEGAVWTVANGIINNGTVRLADDLPDNFVNNGALVLLADDLSLQGIRDFAQVSVAEGVTKVQVDQTQSEYLNGVTTLTDVPAEITSVQINKFDGNMTQATKDTASNTWKLDEGIQLEGIAALYDFTFMPGKYTTEITNAGSRGGTLSLDWNNAGTHQFTIAETLDNISGNLNVSKHPYVDVGSYPTEFTVAVYGTMPQNEHNTLIAFGRRPGGFLALVKGETENDVNLIWAKGDGTGENFQNISSMRAKAATEEKHLYVFEKTANSISVYLDGLEKITVTSTDDNPWPLGNNGGFQVGSVLQGIIEGIANRPDEDTDPATIAMIRVYGEKISADVMAALKAAFPFADEASTSERTLNAEDGLNSWYGEEIGTWTNTPADVGDAGHLPRTNANVTLTVEGDMPQWMSVVLNTNTVDEPNIIGDLHITGSQALTIRKSIGGHPVSVSGILTNDVNLTIHYGAIDLAYTALYLGEGATLTFELSELINDKRDSDRVYLTGVCDNFGTERVTYSYDTTADTFIKFKSLGWDSETQRYYVDFTAPRTARDVWFDPIPGADVTNVLSMAMEVYYEDASTTKTSPILTGDRLHFKSGSEAVVLVPAGKMALASYEIPAGVTVIFEEAFTNRVSGAGTIVMSGCWPSVSQSAVEDSFTTASNWSGTLDISNVNFGNASLVKLGNASSTIRLSGCSIWPQAAYEVTATLEIDNTTYGYGLHFRGVSGEDSGRVVIFDKLAGSGLLMNVADEAVSTHNYLRIKDASEYSGPITNDAAGVTLLFGTGDAAEGSVVITEDTVFKLCSPVYASTNLVVNGVLQVADPGVVVTAESVSFGTDTITGVISITDPEAYPFFNVEKQITGKIGFSLNNFPDGVSPASIQMMRVNEISYLPDEENIKLAAGKADDYALVKDADGRGWSLVRKGFYIRIR